MTMQTGLDTFSHAVEGYCNVMSNMMMDPICEKIMELVAENLPVAVADGSDIQARSRMQVAACMSGWPLTNVYANVGHSLAHVVGANYHIVHGSACSYGLPPVLKHMAPAVPDKVKRIGMILGAEFDGSETPEQIGRKAADAYIAFRDGLGMPPVTEAGIYAQRNALSLIERSPAPACSILILSTPPYPIYLSDHSAPAGKWGFCLCR